MKRAMLVTVLMAANFAATAAVADMPFISKQQQGEYLARDRLIGAKVQNSDGKIVADIEDLILTNDNVVTGVIMGVGGVLGLGEKRVAVPLTALDIEATDSGIKVALPGVSKEDLETAPAYERTQPQKGWLQRAAEKGRELRDKSAETAKDAYEQAKEQAGPAIERAKEAAKNLGNSDEATTPADSEPATPTDSAPATTP